jgi:hypothetical protein
MDQVANDEKLATFKRELAGLINYCSLENMSNTPDFILAEYLTDCLVAFTAASRAREKWYGKELRIGGCSSLEPTLLPQLPTLPG